MADVVEVIHKINYEVNYTSLNKATSAISQQLKELEHLNNTFKGYRLQLNNTTEVKSLEALSVKIGTVTQQIEKQTSKLQGALSQIGKGIAGGLNIPTSLEGLVEKGVSMLKDFAVESGHIAEKAVQAEAAFQGLNRAGLLDDLRAATQGLVSDVDLMQQAVQYEKLGVPVDKLTAAMGYANIKAIATGESVDTLVGNILTGIQEQSLPALEELGIDTSKVKDEFKNTGDFAQAAFSVIMDESVKAGDDLDAFAKKQAEINTNITNMQQGFGNFFNYAKGALFAFGQDIVDTFSNLPDYIRFGPEGGKSNSQKYEEGVKAQELKAASDKAQSDLAKNEYDVSFKSFSDRYQKANAQEKKRIKEEAKRAYEQLKKKRVVEAGGFKPAISVAIAVVDDAYLILFQNLNSSVKEAVKPVYNHKIKAKKIDSSPQKPREVDNINSLPLSNDAPKPSDMKFSTVEAPSFNPDKGPSKAAKKIFGNDLGGMTPEQRREAEIKRSIGAYKQLTQAAVDAYQTITDVQIRALDKEIEIRQKRVDAATKLAERGNTEVLRIEEERLNKAQKKREEIARKQMIVNAALAVSNAIAGIAETATTGPAAIVLIPAVIAAIIAGYAAVTAVTKESTEQAFADGVVGYKGKGGPRDDMNRVWISSGESVITAAGTAKNRELLEAINKGAHFSMLSPQINPMYQLQSPVGSGYASRGEMHTLEKKMDTLIDAVSANGTTVHANVDERGLSLMTVKQIKRDQNRFR